MWVGFFVAVIISICVTCCKQCARTVPLNYIMLLLFTLCWTLVCMCICLFYDPASVFLCATMTMSMVVGICGLAIVVKEEMFWCYGLAASLIMGTIPVIVFNTLGLLTGRNGDGVPLFNSIFGYLFTVLCSIYIIYDVDLICSKLSKDDYVIGALLLYSDIITLFIYIL